MFFLPKLLVSLAMLVSHAALAQSPEASLIPLSQEMREWVHRSCPRTLGPSLWSNCITREASAAARGKPDLAGLKPELQEWVRRSCPDSLGPSLAISCLNRERSALENARFDTSRLSEQQRRWLTASCPSSLGPSLYASCIQRETAALLGVQSVPSQPSTSVPPMSRQRIATPGRSLGRDRYEIEVAHNDEVFVINGEKFEAKTYCFGWEQGDHVLFLDGSPFGACISATLLNLRTNERCSVWCE